METTTGKPEERTVTEAVQEIAESSRQVFREGERIASDVELLKQRVARATDWRVQLRENPVLLVVGAAIAGLALWRILRK